LCHSHNGTTSQLANENKLKKIQQSKKTTTTELLPNSKYIPLQPEAYSHINRENPGPAQQH
jgi:hypothetical protein